MQVDDSQRFGAAKTCVRRLAFALALLLPAVAFAADPQIASLVDDPDPVPAGGLYGYQMRVDNNAADAATNTRLRVTVPAGATFVSATPASQNCAPVSATVVECNLGTLGGLGADVRNVTLTWRAMGPGPTTVNAAAVLTANNDTNAGNNTQNATTTVISGANLSMGKTGTPNPVVGGANVTYTLTAANAGPNASGNIVITDNLPPSVSFVSAAGPGWTCSNAGSVVTCTRPGPHPVGTAIPAVTLVGTVNASGGTVTNSASIAPAVSGGIADPDSANNTATVDTTVIAGADVRIAQKTVTSAVPAVAGANVTFLIEPRNSGPATAVNARVTDTLPAGWTFVSASGPNWACGNAGQAVTCTRASFPVTAAENITVVATAPNNAAVGPTGTSYTNTANVASDTPDPVAGNNSGSVNINVLPNGADLRMGKAKNPNPVALGSNMTSTLTVTNNGPRIATGPLRVVEVLSGETFVSASGSGWVCVPSGAVVVCNHPNASNLGVNASLPALVIVTTATASGVVSNSACTGGSVPPGAGAATASGPAEGDPNPTNDCSTVNATSTTVQPDLAIAKTTSTPAGGDKIVSTGEASVTYTLVVSNVSLAAQNATRAVITDTVPGFISGRSSITSPVVATASGGSSATFNCAIANATVTCTQNGGVLAQGQTVSVPITVNRPLQDGTFTNTGRVSNTAEGDPNSSNNAASDTVTIQPIADVEMTGKTVTPGTVRAGENATYVLSYRNNGPSPALNVVVGDAFTFAPGDTGAAVISVASTKGGSTCSIAAGAQLASASSNFNCTIGTLANGETQTVTLVVRPNYQPGNAARTFGNTANVTTTSVENPAGGDNGNNGRNATLTVSAAAIDLLVNKTDLVDPVPFTAAATFISYRVRVNSNGPSFGTNVRVTETMTPPAARRVRFVCDTTTYGGSICNPAPLCSVGNVTSASGAAIPAFTCAVPAGNAITGLGVGELASGQSKDIFLRFEALDQPAPTGDIFNNAATVLANEPDTFAANNNESEQTTTRQRVDLRVTKSPVPATVALRQPFDWVINVLNNGPGNSIQTDLTDTLPAGVEITGPITWTRTVQPGNGTCTRTGQVVACSLGQLDATGNATITIPSRIVAFPAGGTLANTATVDTDPAKTGGIDTPGGNNTGSGTVNVTRSSLAGTVFQDRDRAGANAGVPQAAASEPRVAGVSVRLTGTDAYGNPVDVTATTDSNGNYTFNDLAPSDATGYTITETQPAGFVNGPTAPPGTGANAPSAGGTYAAGGAAGNSSFTGVVLGGNVAASSYNFPEARQPSLGGFVYLDLNNNGSRDAATDTAIPGATVRLLNASTGAVVATATTDAAGAYVFNNLDPLTPYVLEEPLPTTPPNLQNGPVNPGLIGGAACAAGCTAQANTPSEGTDRIAAIDLSAGTDGIAFNFGERQTTAISGVVFVDANRDNALGGAEAGRVSGVTVRLVQGADCSSGTTLQTTTTAADGSYSFTNVLALQNYLVCETQPTAYGTGSANGVAGSNQIAINNLPVAGSANNNFGETLSSLAGSVYQDTGAGTAANFNNGVRDAGETGIANVPVTLTGTDVSGNPVNVTVNTDTSGNYRFDGLLPPNPGGYTVTEGGVPPAAGTFLDGRDTAGSAGGSAAVNDTVSGIGFPGGTQAAGYNFGELPNAGITGTVYIDRNRDNTLAPAPTDGRIPGVTVRLVQGTDCTSGTTLQTTTTDASGNYAFNGVATGGNYLVCQTQPPGYQNGTQNPGTNAASPADNAIAITNLPATGSAGNHFGERVGSLAGSVYVDLSPGTPANTNNGVRDAGETGIAGVPVTLTGRDIAGNTVSLNTTTDASGNYSFPDLLQSNAAGYTITESAIPATAGRFNDGKDAAGTAGGSVAVNDVASAIVLGAGTQGTGYNFGELAIAPITGTVYLDRDRDNQIDPAPTDGRLGGVTLTLYAGTSCTGTPVATTTSDSSGNYTFSGASAGLTYTVCETQPAGYGDGGVNPGASGSSSTANAITITRLPAAGSAGNHFGERAGSIAGGVYLDANNDGTRQAADPPIAGVTVTLTGTDAAGAPVNRTATTDAAGNYSFIDLPAAGAGGYTVTEQTAQPVVGGVATLNGRTSAGTIAGANSGTATAVATTPSAVSGINLPAGADSVANNFGEILPVGISGQVFTDLNDNGIINGPGDAGIGGVTIVITGTDDTGAPVSRTVTTAPDGTYTVPDLRPGTYTITEPTQPPGTSNGKTTAGTAGGTASPQTTTPSTVTAIVLGTPGVTSTGNNFAEVPTSSAVLGRVWLDADNSGTIEPAETGIAGVTVELTGTDNLGQTVTRSTTTDAAGNYAFTNLSPGTYAVREPTQPPSTVNGSTVAGSTGGTATPVATAPSAVTGIVLGPNQTSSANNFGEVPAGLVSGRVYADNNNNGSIDGTELGLGGATVVLTGTDDRGQTVNVSVITAPDGTYTFPNLRPGTYAVTEPTQPGGTVNGITTPGTLGGTATGPGTAPSAITGIVLAPGGSSLNNNFGEIGNSPDLRVSKSHSEAVLTSTKPVTYRISVRNVGEVATTGSYEVADRLPTGLTLAATPTGTGWACVGAAGASSFTCTSSTVVAAAATNADTITVVANVGAAAAAASPVNNVVLVEGGGEIDARRPSAAERDAFNNNPGALPVCTPAVEHNVCRDPATVQLAASLSGTVWYDVGSASRLLDGADRRLPGWQVEIVSVADGTVVGRATTGTDGTYRVADLIPGVAYSVRFRDPQSGVVFGYPVNGETAPGSSGVGCVNGTPAPGTASSCVGSGANPQLGIVLAPGQNLPQQSLPVDPSGVVYDSGLRQPVPGSVVTMAPVGACPGWNPATSIVGAGLGGYTVAGDAISMTVGNDGFYQYLLAPAAPPSCTFGLTVTPPSSAYTFQSSAIPPTAGPLVPPGGAGSVFNVQPQAAAPTGPIGSGTTYYLTFTTGSAGANIVHNHIPLDPFPPTGITLSKTGDKSAAEVGDSVRYTITVQVTAGPRPRQTTVVDRLPAGFTYIRGTASANDVPIADPAGGVGPTLAFNLGEMPASNQLVLRYRVRVGVGAQQGDGINRAKAHACGAPTGCVGPDFTPLVGSIATNEARFRVRVSGGVFAPEACLLGKVFVDCNGNHIQDREELGIPGVRLVLNDGTNLISDSEGKYSFCGLPPKSHVLKVDPSTMPRGSRLTTSSNRNLGDAGSLWLDLKNGELHRGDFIEGSCSNTVLEQTKARRAQGEVRAPEVEKQSGPALRFDSKAHGLDTIKSPQQGTDGANQQAPKPRSPAPGTDPLLPRTDDDLDVPVPSLPLNRPPPKGRDSGMVPSVPASGGASGTR